MNTQYQLVAYIHTTNDNTLELYIHDDYHNIK